MRTGSLLETLVVVARTPGAGGARPKLVAQVGEVEAERLHAAFLSDAVQVAGAWKTREGSQEQREVALYLGDATDDALAAELASVAHARLRVPSGHDLGEQVKHALQDELDRGAHRVLALFPHAPSLPVHLVEEGFRAVCFQDAVVGPSFDGGIWALGVRRDPDHDAVKETALYAAVLEKQPWDTHGLLQSMTERSHKAGFHLHWLPFWMDAADQAALPRLKTYLRYQELRGATAGAATRAALNHAPPPAPPTVVRARRH